MRCNSLELTPAGALRAATSPGKGRATARDSRFRRLASPRTPSGGWIPVTQALGDVGIEPFVLLEENGQCQDLAFRRAVERFHAGELISVVFWGSCDTTGRHSGVTT
jgi:hypothetical protein